MAIPLSSPSSCSRRRACSQALISPAFAAQNAGQDLGKSNTGGQYGRYWGNAGAQCILMSTFFSKVFSFKVSWDSGDLFSDVSGNCNQLETVTTKNGQKLWLQPPTAKAEWINHFVTIHRHLAFCTRSALRAFRFSWGGTVSELQLPVAPAPAPYTKKAAMVGVLVARLLKVAAQGGCLQTCLEPRHPFTSLLLVPTGN